MNESWWSSELSELIQQGDVIELSSHGRLRYPITLLEKGTVKGNVTAWFERAVGSHDRGLAQVEHTTKFGLVVSYDCEIDKGASVCAIAPMRSLDKLKAEDKERIVRQSVFRFVPLMGIPNLGNYYADLRHVAPIDLEFAKGVRRVASMTEDARLRLKAQLIGFFTRLELRGVEADQDLKSSERRANPQT